VCLLPPKRVTENTMIFWQKPPDRDVEGLASRLDSARQIGANWGQNTIVLLRFIGIPSFPQLD